MNRYLVEIPIIRRNFDTTSSARYRGSLTMVSNKHGVIYDWKINLIDVYIDILTTKSWFIKKTTNFKRRETLFKKLGLEQIIRQKTSTNNLVHLNSQQLMELNNFLNNRLEYNSTIKNILPLLKGNNPGGEVLRPKSAELIVNDNSKISNFVVLIDDLIMKQKVAFHSVSIGAQKISFSEFCNLNNDLKAAFDYMQESKDLSSWSEYLYNIKEYYKKYNLIAKKAYVISERARAKFSKNIDKSIDSFPFGFVSSLEFQKCHIYEYHDLRDKIVEAIRTEKNYSIFEKMIQDENNFIPLPESAHRKFDANWFTYKLNGDILPINTKGKEFIENHIDNKFYRIPDFFLTKKRVFYLNKRNEKALEKNI